MHNIDQVKLVADVRRTIYRSNYVLQDPPVTKAGQQAWDDVRQAASSTGQFVSEVRSSWLRSAGA